MRTSIVAILVAGLGAATVACTNDVSNDKGWTYQSDARHADAGADSGPVHCGPGTQFDPASGECEPSSSNDTGFPNSDATSTDSSDADPPTQPTAGQSFEGPLAIGDGDTPVEPDHGLGLYWKNALVQFDNHALHRHLGDQRILDLSRIQTPVGREDFRARLPERPDEKLHFYREYCAEAGADTCAEQGIDDDIPTFALAMVGLHQAPASGDASDCTWRMVYGKQTCDFGSVVAPSKAILLYAYRPFVTTDYPVFDYLDVGSAEVSSGYHLIVSRVSADGRRVVSLEEYRGTIDVRSTVMFPMLYP